MGQGLTAPPPAHPLGRGAMEGLRPQGKVPSPSALPWPRLGLPERPVDAEPALNLCEAISSLSTPPPWWEAGRAHASHPEERALSRTPCHWHQPRVPLMVLGAATPHPPCAPERLAHGGLVRITQGLHGVPLPHPPQPRPLRRWWQGRGGGGGRLQRVPVARRRLEPARPCPCRTRAPPL